MTAVSFPAWLFEWSDEVFLTTRDPVDKIGKLTQTDIEQLRDYDLLHAQPLHDVLNDYETPPTKGYALEVIVQVTIHF